MPNPFKKFFAWYFVDADGVEHGPYLVERHALRALLHYITEKRT
jgi:hypothetical protein